MNSKWIAQFAAVILLGSPSGVLAVEHDSSVRESFKEPHIQVNLLSDRETVEPGGALTVGVQFAIEKGWHIYWKNPGQSGLPTMITPLPAEGVAFDTAVWPTPSAFRFDDLVNYGYEDTPLFLQGVRFAKDNVGAAINTVLPLKVSWVLCRDECIPGDATLGLHITNGKVQTSLVNAAAIDASAKNQHRDAPFSTTAKIDNGSLILNLRELPKPLKSAQFAPATIDLVDPALAQDLRVGSTSEANLRVPLMDVDANDLGALSGVIFLNYEDGSQDAFTLALGSTTATTAEPMSFGSLLGILVSAFLGGLILNLMPCVFPVLSLKVASLVEHAHSKSSRNHMLMFVAGVLASFLTLAAVLSILRMIGQGVGWGFQFQSPVFVALMVILTFLLGLNLAGVFEVGLALQSKAGSVKVSEGYTGSFMSGVLATTLATPCTAPFMGSAIAFALTAPIWGVFAVFVALGLGMGSPFLVLAVSPALMRFLPRPGAWMESFKQALAFPMFATSVWLLSVLGAQEGINSMTMCAFGLIILSISVWQLGRWGALHQPLRIRQMSRAVGAVFAILGIWVALPQGNNAEAAQSATIRGEDTVEAFTPARVKELQAEGRNIMVDFTAAWCLVCKVNHARVLTSSSVQSLLTKKNVAVLKADWTRRDPAITEALQSLGKSGVPLIVLYPAGNGAPIQFEALLSPGDFEKALEALP